MFWSKKGAVPKDERTACGVVVGKLIERSKTS